MSGDWNRLQRLVVPGEPRCLRPRFRLETTESPHEHHLQNGAPFLPPSQTNLQPVQGGVIFFRGRRLRNNIPLVRLFPTSLSELFVMLRYV
jgi:hypothetical protein